jgi:hypothetical protein
MPEFPLPEGVEAQFRRLIHELATASLQRARFESWEMEILLDLESCNLAGPSRLRILRGYEKAVLEYLERGARLPFKLSAYLDSLKLKEGTAEGKLRKLPASHAPAKQRKRGRH